MKKSFLKILAVVMAMLLVCSMVIIVYGTVTSQETETEQAEKLLETKETLESEKTNEEIVTEYEAKKAAQRNASKANQLLMQYFEKDGELVFPDYYAGAYIENNEFVVCFTNAPANIEETYDRVFGEYANVVRYVYRKYSIAELEEYAHMLDKQLCDAGYRVTGYGVDVINNEIDMTVLEEDVAAAQAAIVQLLIEDGIRIDIYAGGYSEEATEVIGGEKFVR